ncbi:unnamed protein product [Boreogadus saida]
MTRHIVTTWSRAGRFAVCDDLAISDHLAISFSVPVPLPSQPSKQTITFRKTKQVCASLLSSTLATHLATPPPNTYVDGLVEHYNTALSLSLDSLSRPSHRPCCFSSFTTLDSDQVLDLVSKAKTSSSKLDPMPTTLVKTCLPVT